MTKRIVLTKGHTALIDDRFYDAVTKFKWAADERGDRIYACRRPRSGKVYLHRYIMELAGTPAASRQDVDHINGDSLDNRLENLRAVPRKVNVANGYLAREKALRDELDAVKRDRDRWKWVAEHKPGLVPSDDFVRRWVAVGRPDEEMKALTAMYDESKDTLRYGTPCYAEEVGDNADFMAEWQAERRDMARMPEEASDD